MQEARFDDHCRSHAHGQIRWLAQRSGAPTYPRLAEPDLVRELPLNMKAGTTPSAKSGVPQASDTALSSDVQTDPTGPWLFRRGLVCSVMRGGKVDPMPERQRLRRTAKIGLASNRQWRTRRVRRRQQACFLVPVPVRDAGAWGLQAKADLCHPAPPAQTRSRRRPGSIRNRPCRQTEAATRKPRLPVVLSGGLPVRECT